MALSGYWRLTTENGTERFVSCEPSVACAGANECSFGYMGPQCSACVTGTHTRNTFNSQCDECPAGAQWRLVAIFAGAIVVGFILCVSACWRDVLRAGC